MTGGILFILYLPCSSIFKSLEVAWPNSKLKIKIGSFFLNIRVGEQFTDDDTLCLLMNTRSFFAFGCIPNSWEFEVGRLLWVWGQPGLQSIRPCRGGDGGFVVQWLKRTSWKLSSSFQISVNYWKNRINNTDFTLLRYSLSKRLNVGFVHLFVLVWITDTYF